MTKDNKTNNFSDFKFNRKIILLLSAIIGIIFLLIFFFRIIYITILWMVFILSLIVILYSCVELIRSLSTTKDADKKRPQGRVNALKLYGNLGIIAICLAIVCWFLIPNQLKESDKNNQGGEKVVSNSTTEEITDSQTTIQSKSTELLREAARRIETLENQLKESEKNNQDGEKVVSNGTTGEITDSQTTIQSKSTALILEAARRIETLETDLEKQVMGGVLNRITLVSNLEERHRELLEFVAQLPAPVIIPQTVITQQNDNEALLINMLVLYAVRLQENRYAGTSHFIVKNALQDDYVLEGIPHETEDLVGDLLYICKEAERKFDDLDYIKEIARIETNQIGVSIATNFGKAAAAALIAGDPILLTSGIAGIFTAYGDLSDVDAEENRKIAVQLQQFNGYIDGFLLKINSRRSKLERSSEFSANQFITASIARQLNEINNNSDLQKKAARLESFSKRTPQFPEVKYFLGDCEIERKRYQEALPHLIEVSNLKRPLLRVDGLVFKAHLKLAEAYWRLQESAKGIAASNKALALIPDNLDALLLRGVCQYQNNNFTDAKTDLLKVKQLRHNHQKNTLIATWPGLFLACIEMSEGKVNEATKYLLDSLRMGYRNAKFLANWNELSKKIIATKAGQELFTPQLAVWFKPGLWWDDLQFKNKCEFDLSNCTVQVNLKHFEDGQYENIKRSLGPWTFKRGGHESLTNIVSVPSGNKCEISLTIDADQLLKPHTLNFLFDGSVVRDWVFCKKQ